MRQHSSKPTPTLTRSKSTQVYSIHIIWKCSATVWRKLACSIKLQISTKPLDYGAYNSISRILRWICVPLALEDSSYLTFKTIPDKDLRMSVFSMHSWRARESPHHKSSHNGARRLSPFSSRPNSAGLPMRSFKERFSWPIIVSLQDRISGTTVLWNGSCLPLMEPSIARES